jgi:hypothetical protein
MGPELIAPKLVTTLFEVFPVTLHRAQVPTMLVTAPVEATGAVVVELPLQATRAIDAISTEATLSEPRLGFI